MPEDPFRGEAFSERMLRDLRDLLVVVERRLRQLREAGSRNRVVHMEALRKRTAGLIERLVAKKPGKP